MLGATALAKRQKEGFDGKFELGERTVPDPLDPGNYVNAIVNVRESAIDHMMARNRLQPEQYEAGARFRRLWELCAIGRQRGIDPSSSGRSEGAVSDPLTEELVRAGREIARAMQRVGKTRAAILTSIVGEGKLIDEVARRWAGAGGVVAGRRAEGYVTGTLVDALDDLVELWGMRSHGRPNRESGVYKRKGEEIPVRDAIRTSGPIEETGPANEISVDRLGDVRVRQKRGLDRGTMTTDVSGNANHSARRKKR